MKSLPEGHSVALVVNNAGATTKGLFEKLTIKDCTDMLDVNVMHVAIFSKKFVDYFMSQRKPKDLKSGLINVSSLMGYMEGAGAAVYSSTKAFVTFLTHPLAFEIGTDIDIQCLTPSMTKTNLLHGKQLPFADYFPPSREVASSLNQLPTGQTMTAGHWSHDI